MYTEVSFFFTEMMHQKIWPILSVRSVKPMYPDGIPEMCIQAYMKQHGRSRYHLLAVEGLIIGLRPANERRRYFVTTSLIGWA